MWFINRYYFEQAYHEFSIMNNHSFITHDEITEVDQQITESFHREQLYSAFTSTSPKQNTSKSPGYDLLFERRQRERTDDFEQIIGFTCAVHFVMHFIKILDDFSRF